VARALQAPQAKLNGHLTGYANEKTKLTNEDIQRLSKMVAEGASAVRTAVALKKTTNTIKLMARELGLKFPRVPRFSFDRINRRPGTR
jgi:hypothetical protein